MAKFSGFRTLKTAGTLGDVITYLSTQLAITLRELQSGLFKLSLSDNFESQTLQVTIPSGATSTYTHNLGSIPSGRLIVKANGSTIDDSDTPWTKETVYFRNSGAATITATIILLK